MNVTELPTELLALICQELSDIKELFVFESVCKIFRIAANQEEVWKYRIRKDYSLLSYVSGRSPVFRKRGFRQLYQALRNPQVFVWGSKENGRLGVPQNELNELGSYYQELDYPLWLQSMSDKGVAQIVCGGFMMLALTHNKEIYFWGTFSNTYLRPFSNSKETPHKLSIFPNDALTHQIAAGRSHALALSEKGVVYQFDNPQFKAPSMEFREIDSQISQISCGFNSCLALTFDHQVLYWDYVLGKIPTSYKKLVCSDLQAGERIIKVTGGDKFSLGLTNQGRVIKWNLTEEQEIETESSDNEDTYESEEENAVSEHNEPDVYEDTDANMDFHESDEFTFEEQGTNERANDLGKPPSKFSLSPGQEVQGSFVLELAQRNIRHIVAQFENFGLFEEGGKLWVGRCTEVNESDHLDITECEISDSGNPILASFGDWHSAALLDNGRLYTWGEHGLGHGPTTENITLPKRVEYFDESHFVFYVGCAGWHTAALAVNLSNGPKGSSINP